jgi:iron complex outermembrane receptor protein
VSALAFVFVLHPRPVPADDTVEVQVRGDRPGVPSHDPSVAGSVIREERLKSPGLTSADVLRMQPGVAVFDTGGFGALSTASIRAAAPAETPVYLAGIRINDDVGGTADLSTVPLWLVHRVDVYRSNAPLAADQLGLGGAIFFEPRWPKGNEAVAGAMAGSFGARAGWFNAGVGDERGAAMIGVRLESARNDFPFVNDQGTRFDPRDDRVVRLNNNDAKSFELWGLGSADIGPSAHLHVVFNALDKDQGFAGLKLLPSTAARVTFHRRVAAVSTALPCGGDCELTTTTAAIFSHSRYDDPLREALLNATSVDFDATRVEDAVAVRVALADSLSITPSVRAALERSSTEVAGDASTRARGARARRAFARAAAQIEWFAGDAVTLRALGSAECHHTALVGSGPFFLPGGAAGLAGDGTACHPLDLTGRFGIELGRSPFAVLANIGRYARVPTLSELYGISGAVRGNEMLAPETGVSAELGTRVSSPSGRALGRVSLDVFAFVRVAKDFISYERAAQGYVRPANLGSARVIGFEALTDYRPFPDLLLEVSATALDPRDTSAAHLVNDLLPYQSRLQVASRVELRTAVPSDFIRAAATSVSYFYQASRYADPAGLVVIPEQGSLDVDGELALAEGLWLRGRVANVLDATRFDLVGFPLPGRAAYLSMEARW